MNFEIKPNEKIGPIALGVTREEVRAILGDDAFSGTSGESDYYFSNAIQIEFENNIADFIGVSFSSDYTVFYQDVNVFDLESEELFILIASHESNEHKYNASEYVFPDQIITLWDADSQYDRIGGESRPIWGQVGIGSKSYLKAVI
ncbi:hypothetical protein [Pseudoalteromonas piscicida]|uniref:hypothetical protein n=1 Tax=Pseudoalteromonas piscicida TaxID=43662 RepID=UPI001D0AC6C0|nr:hypothetical protein [Pseudoalteromonas piscicida]